MPVATPVQVTYPAAPPITVVAPPAPAPTPVVDDEPAPVVEPRATSPTIDAACVPIVTPDTETELPASCSWDDGFPAISHDGKLVVTKHIPDDGGRGNPGLTIRFIDVKTSRIVTEVLVLDPDEIDALYDETMGMANAEKLRALVAKRAATAQRLVDARGYRTMQPLGVNDGYGGETRADTTRVHAEFDGTAVRAIDPTTQRVLWRERFDVVRRAKRTDPDGECGGWGFRGLSVAWDPATKIVLATSEYGSGGCMCPVVTIEQVRQLR